MNGQFYKTDQITKRQAYTPPFTFTDYLKFSFSNCLKNQKEWIYILLILLTCQHMAIATTINSIDKDLQCQEQEEEKKGNSFNQTNLSNISILSNFSKGLKDLQAYFSSTLPMDFLPIQSKMIGACPQIESIAASTYQICSGDAISLHANIIEPDYGQLTWFYSNGTMVQNPDTLIINSNICDTITYYFFAKYTPSTPNCSIEYSDSIAIKVYPSLSGYITSLNDNDNCGLKLLLDCEGYFGYEITWNDGINSGTGNEYIGKSGEQGSVIFSVVNPLVPTVLSCANEKFTYTYQCPTCPTIKNVEVDKPVVCSGDMVGLKATITDTDNIGASLTWYDEYDNIVEKPNEVALTTENCQVTTYKYYAKLNTSTSSCHEQISDTVTITVYPTITAYTNYDSSNCSVNLTIDCATTFDYITTWETANQTGPGTHFSGNPTENGVVTFTVINNQLANYPTISCSKATFEANYNCPSCPTITAQSVSSSAVCSEEVISLTATVDNPNQVTGTLEWFNEAGGLVANPNELRLQHTDCGILTRSFVPAFCPNQAGFCDTIYGDTLRVAIYPPIEGNVSIDNCMANLSLACPNETNYLINWEFNGETGTGTNVTASTNIVDTVKFEVKYKNAPTELACVYKVWEDVLSCDNAKCDLDFTTRITNTADCPTEPCQAFQYSMTNPSEFVGSGHAMFLPDFPVGERVFIFNEAGGKISFYTDGTGHLTDTVYVKEAPTKAFVVDVWFENKLTWEEWRNNNPSIAETSLYKDDTGFGIINEAYKNWFYYLMSDSKANTLTGIYDYEGYTLTLNHHFGNTEQHYAFQLGENGANDKNDNYGFAGWFTYEGKATTNTANPIDYLTKNGFGDFNITIFCNENIYCQQGIEVVVNNGSEPYTITWNNQQTGASIDELCIGTYTVNITDAQGCTGQKNITLSPELCPPPTPCPTIEIEETVNKNCGALTYQTFQYTVTDPAIYEKSGHYVFLPNFPVGQRVYVFDEEGGTMQFFPDGTAHIQDTVFSQENPTKAFVIDAWFMQKQNWKDWKFNNPSFTEDKLYKDETGLGTTNENFKDWSFYIMNPTKSNTLTGLYDYAGYTLSLTHDFAEPEYHYGFQLGSNGANDKNATFGFSGWFSYSGRADDTINNPISYLVGEDRGDINATLFPTYSNSCGQEIRINVIGGESPYQYVWNTGAMTENLSNLCEGNYTITVTDANDCKQTKTIILTSNFCTCEAYRPIPKKDTLSICANEELPTLEVIDNGFTYNWYETATSNTPLASNSTTFTPTQLGTYYVAAVKAGSNCTSLRSAITILEQPTPTVTLGEDITVNQSDFPITLTAITDATDILWSTGATSATVEVNQSGTYSVLVKNEFGCSNTDTIVVKVNTPPNCPNFTSVSATKVSACHGDTIQLNAVIENQDAGSIVWFDEQDMTVTHQELILTTAACESRLATYYAVFVPENQACPTITSEKVAISIYPAIDGQLVTSEDSCTVTFEPTCTNFNVSWKDNFDKVAIGNTYTATQETKGSVTFTVSNSNACKKTYTANYNCTSNPECPSLPFFTTVVNEICSGTAISLPTNIVSNEDGGTLTWFDQANNKVATPDSLVLTTENCEGQYYNFNVRYIPTTAGCDTIYSGSITYLVYPTISGTPTLTDCGITISQDCPNYTASWQDNLGNSGTGFSYTADDNTSGTVVFTLENKAENIANEQLTCLKEVFSMNFNCNTNCEAESGEIAVSDTIVCLGLYPYIAVSNTVSPKEGFEYAYFVTDPEGQVVVTASADTMINFGPLAGGNYCVYGIQYTTPFVLSFSHVNELAGCFDVTNCVKVRYVNTIPEATITTDPVCNDDGTFSVGVTVIGGTATSTVTISGAATGEFVATRDVEKIITLPADSTMMFGLFAIDEETGCSQDFIPLFGPVYCPNQKEEGTATGFIWDDSDMDGIQDTDELGLGGVQVILQNEEGEEVTSTITNPDGTYTIPAIPVGNYTIKINAPTGFVGSPKNEGNNPDIDSDLNPFLGISDEFAITTGSTVEVDGGFFPTPLMTIGGIAWNDLNANGIFDLGESGLVGVSVTLINATNNTIIDTQISETDGSYSFGGLSVGNYRVEVEESTGLNFITTPAFYEVELEQGTNFLTANFGFVDELPTPDVEAIDDTANTDSSSPITIPVLDNDLPINGNYGIINVTDPVNGGTVIINPDSTITYTPPADFVGVDSFQYTIQGEGDDNTDTAWVVVTVAANPTGTVSGFVWQDNDMDGIQDGDELGLDSVTVVLQTIQGATISTTLSDENGLYSFNNIPTGEYLITFERPTDYFFSPQNQGNDNTKDSDPNPANGQTPPFFLAANETISFDAGFILTPIMSIGDFVWEDVNGNGIVDLGESGLVGVTVTLIDANNNVIDTKVSDEDGFYLFSGLVVGTYTITVDESTGLDFLTTTNTYTVILEEGESFLDGDFGFTNTPPTGNIEAIDDAIETPSNTPITIPVLDNDLPDTGGFNILETGTPVNGGTVTINPDSTLTYTPPTGFVGVDSFFYVIGGDDFPNNDTAWVVITVNEVIEIGTIGGTAWNDENGDGIFDDNENGLAGVEVTLTNASNGFVIGTQTSDVDGTYSFQNLAPGNYQLTVNELTGLTFITTVNFYDVELLPNTSFLDGNFGFTTTPPLEALNAVNDIAITDENQPVTIDVLANDTPTDGDFGITETGDPVNGGTVTINPDSTLTYTPPTDFTGIDSFYYVIAGEDFPTTDTAWVVINIRPSTNEAPTMDTLYTCTGVTTAKDLCINATDPNGDAVKITEIASVYNAMTIQLNDTCFRYTPSPGFMAVDTVKVTICDDNATSLCSTGIVIVSVPCPANPINAIDDAATTLENEAIPIDILANDIVDNLQDLNIVENPSNGTLLLMNNEVVYVPAVGFTGVDTFTYEITDGAGQTDQAIVVVTVLSKPSVCNDTIFLCVEKLTATELCPEFCEQVGTQTTVKVEKTAINGVIVPAGNCYQYIPQVDYEGTETISFKACNDSICATVTYEILVQTACSIMAQNDNATTFVNVPITINVLNNDIEPDNLPLTITETTTPQNGSVVIDNNQIVYTPTPDFVGTDEFDYVICNPNNQCDTATITVIVIPTTPCEENVTTCVADNESSEICVTFCNVPDAQVTDVQTVLTSSITDIVDNCFLYTPPANYTGQEDLVIIGCNANNICDTVYLSVTIGCIEPTAQDDSGVVREGETVTIDVLANDEQLCGFNLKSILFSQPMYGSVTLDSLGNLAYTAENGTSNLIDTLQYLACNDCEEPSCDTADVIITIIPPTFSLPEAQPDVATTPENTPVDIEVLANDIPEDVEVTAFTQPENGTVVLNDDDTFTYTPNPDFVGEDFFFYTICNFGGCDSTIVGITVFEENTPNQPPIAQDDVAETDPNQPVTIPILANDTDPENQPLTVTETTDPENGTVTINPDGTVTYTPDPDFTGIDTFTYVVCDNATPPACDTAVVEVAVGEDPTNNPPIAENDEAITMVNTPIDIAILENDVEPDGDNVTTIIATPPANGIVDLLSDSTVTYTPNDGFSGEDFFLYVICDDKIPSLCDTAYVTITITDENLPPIARDDAYEGVVNVPMILDILTNDFDPDNTIEELTISIVENPENGTVAIGPADSLVTYTPNTDFVGNDTFTYIICDPFNACDTAIVTLVIEDIIPIDAEPDVAFTLENTPVDIPILDNDEGTQIQLTEITEDPENGSVTINPDGTVTYTPNPDFIGEDFFFYEICDLSGNCDETIVGVTVSPEETPNRPPTANNDVDSTAVNTPITLPVLANDSDPDGDELTVTTVTEPENGGATINEDGTITYTPDANFTGFDTFEYTVCDDSGLCDTATVGIGVEDGLPNNPPIAIDDDTITAVNTPVIIPILNNDSDPDGDDLVTVIIATPASNGTVDVNGDNTTTYTPEPDFIGEDYYIYIVCDNGNPVLCDTAYVNITVVDDGNELTITEETPEDTPITICVEDYVLLPFGVDYINFVSNPTNGTAFLNTDPPSDSCFTYVPNPDFVGIDSFTIEICDNEDVCTPITVLIDVTPVNDAPVAVNDTVTTPVNTPITIEVLTNDFDVDEDTLSVLAIEEEPANGTATIDETGTTVLYTPDVDFIGADSFIYVITDPEGLMDTATAFITIVDSINTPIVVAVDDSSTTTINTPITILVLNNDTLENLAPETPITITITDNPNHGIVEVNSDGTDDFSVIYTPESDFIGVDTFEYVVCDGAICDTALVVVNVTEDIIEPCDPENLTIPTGFSPNGDDINDTFLIDGLEGCANKIVIFNRWGDIVFEQNNYSETNAWDGTWQSNGNDLPIGTYYYILTIEGLNGEGNSIANRNGFITLHR